MSVLFSTFQRGSMHEVGKILVFFITLTLTISGLPIRQGFSPIAFVHLTSLPIATAWEMIFETSYVNGITTASLKPPQNFSHPSRSSLHLTPHDIMSLRCEMGPPPPPAPPDKPAEPTPLF
jgi:hypothetical protein